MAPKIDLLVDMSWLRISIALGGDELMSCIAIEKLAALAQHQLSAVEAERLHGHLATGCDVCRRQLDHVRQILAAMADQEMSEPPEWLLQQAMKLFAWRKKKRRENSGKGIPGFLLVNNAAQRLPLGCRSASSVTRHMLYRAGNYDIDVFIECVKSSPLVNIIGQAMPVGVGLETVANGDVELSTDSTLVLATRTNEVGRFTLDGIQEGVYDLKLRFNDEELDIVGLNVLAQNC